MQIPKNTLKQQLATGKPQIGFFNGIPSPYIAEICAGAGFDWVVIDEEHSPFDLPLILQQIQAMTAFNVPILVRPPEGSGDQDPLSDEVYISMCISMKTR